LPARFSIWALTWSPFSIRPLNVAAHAGQAGFHRPVGPLRVADDLDGALVDAPALGVDDHVALQPVGQAEQDLAAVGLEVERVLEDVLVAGVAGEVEGAPEGPGLEVPALQDTVVAGDAGVGEPGPGRGRRVRAVGAAPADLELVPQFPLGAGQVEEGGIQRRP
jgi:hypothetical protein